MNSLFRVSARNHAGLILMTELARTTARVLNIQRPARPAARDEVLGTGYLSLNEVAESMGLSQGFLEEIAMALKKAGLIMGRQGPGGGYRLAKPATKITAEQVLVALEGPIVLVDCHGASCPVAAACASKSLWGFLQKDVLSSLRKTTLAKIIKS